MPDFLNNIESMLKNVFATHDATGDLSDDDKAALTQAAVTAVQPQIDALTARVTDLETAITDTVTHLQAGDTNAAMATATAAAPAAGDAGAAGDASAAGDTGTGS